MHMMLPVTAAQAHAVEEEENAGEKGRERKTEGVLGLGSGGEIRREAKTSGFAFYAVGREAEKRFRDMEAEECPTGLEGLWSVLQGGEVVCGEVRETATGRVGDLVGGQAATNFGEIRAGSWWRKSSSRIQPNARTFGSSLPHSVCAKKQRGFYLTEFGGKGGGGRILWTVDGEAYGALVQGLLYRGDPRRRGTRRRQRG